MKKYRNLFSDVFVASGAAIVLFSIALVILVLITAVPTANPYLGLFVFIFLPIAAIIGAILFVLGILLSRRKEKPAVDTGRFTRFTALLKSFFKPDLSQPQNRRRLMFFLAAGFIEVVVLAFGGMRMAEYMNTPEFCGKPCHEVMNPEYVAYQNSTHARVDCVDCHIGPGAPWLVRSKITGIKQLVATVFNTYDKPISTPVESLRPARETCEVCHWPGKFSGDLVRINRRYQIDEANTPDQTTMVFRVGGGEKEVAQGIHWHIAAAVWYLPLDEKRQQIAWVGVEDKSGDLTEYVDPNVSAQITPERIKDSKRLMDCVDCHNRATHIFYRPDELIDQALLQGKLDASLPFIKRESVSAFEGVGIDLQVALSNIEKIRSFYQTQYPQLYQEKSAQVENALQTLKKIAQSIIFPDMRVNWETHVDNLGHQNSAGCFRCHGKLVAISGENKGATVDAGCNTCHYSL